LVTKKRTDGQVVKAVKGGDATRPPWWGDLRRTPIFLIQALSEGEGKKGILKVKKENNVGRKILAFGFRSCEEGERDQKLR